MVGLKVFLSQLYLLEIAAKISKVLGASRNENPAWAKTRLVIGLANNLLLYQLTFNNNSPQTRQFLHDKMLKKQNWQAKMRIQQIIEFKLKGPGALSHYMYSYKWLFS